MLKCISRTISFKILFGLIFLTPFFKACRVMPSHTADQLVFSMEKTACMGQCPVYTLKVYEDGWAELQGTANIDHIGKYQFKLPPQDLTEIRAAFKKCEYFALDEKYYANFSDLPTTFLFYQDGENSKKVMDYYGAPAKVKELERYLETFLNKKWKKSVN